MMTRFRCFSHANRWHLMARTAPLMFLMMVAALQPALGQQRFVTVLGTGEVKTKSDIAHIHVGVVTHAPSAAEAVEQNNEAMRTLIATLKEQGLKENEIQTSNFTVLPQYRHRPEKPEEPTLTGYQVTNSVRITVRELESLGKILDKVVAEGANQVHSIQLGVREPEPHQDEARRKAIANARHRAEILAEASDTKLGKILRIQEATSLPPQPLMATGARMFAAESAVPIEAGEQSIVAQIQVTFELGD